MAGWEDHTRDNLFSVKIDTSGQGQITASWNLRPGQLLEIEQVNLYTINHSIQGASIMKGIGSTSQIICATPVFAQVGTPALQAASSAVAIGPPYIYLQADEAITTQCWGGTSGDFFYTYIIYRIGYLYDSPALAGF